MATETAKSAEAKKAPVPPAKKPPELPENAKPTTEGDVDQAGDVDAETPLAPPVHKLPFMQRAWVQDVLPLATSVILHVAIIAIGIATYKTYKVLVKVTEEQAIIPDAAIVENADVGGIPNPGLGGDPTKAAAQDEYKDAPNNTDAWNTKPSESLAQSLAGGAGDTQADASIGPNTAFGSASGTGTGSGDSGGAVARYGPPGGGGGIGPKSPFMGVSGNANQVIYICDATGTMLGLKFELLKQQLFKAVSDLKASQKFNIIFFHGLRSKNNSWFTPFDKTLRPAVPNVKKAAFAFMEQVDILGEGTDPVPALQAAIQQKPQLIYFLSDGAFNSNASYEDVINAINTANPDHKVKINTILLVETENERTKTDPDLQKAEETLQKIASENGGRFKRVTADSLQ